MKEVQASLKASIMLCTRAIEFEMSVPMTGANMPTGLTTESPGMVNSSQVLMSFAEELSEHGRDDLGWEGVILTSQHQSASVW